MAFWSSDEDKDWELRPLKSSGDERVNSTESDTEDSGMEDNRKQHIIYEMDAFHKSRHILDGEGSIDVERTPLDWLTSESQLDSLM